MRMAVTDVVRLMGLRKTKRLQIATNTIARSNKAKGLYKRFLSILRDLSTAKHENEPTDALRALPYSHVLLMAYLVRFP